MFARMKFPARLSGSIAAAALLIALAGVEPARLPGQDGAGAPTGPSAAPSGAPPRGFCDLAQRVPGVLVDLRYFKADNFVGQRITGYEADRCIVSNEVADALANVQLDLNRFGFGLKVFDGYRPQRAVDHFVRWTANGDQSTKREYYPHIAKKDLIAGGYIAAQSGHSRGSAVDVTLVALSRTTGNVGAPELDMGTRFDFFGTASQSDFPNLTTEQRKNRLLLRTVMEKHGFDHLPGEWWHFSLKLEPYPDTYFDFPIR